MIEILTNFDDTPLEKIETLEFDIKNYNQYINMWKNIKIKDLYIINLILMMILGTLFWEKLMNSI